MRRAESRSRKSLRKRALSQVKRRGREPEYQRVVIDSVGPAIERGRWPIKRTPGEVVDVEAVIVIDGHEQPAAVARYRRDGGNWSEVPLAPQGNDRWTGQFLVTKMGDYEFTVQAWVDRFQTWRGGLAKKWEAKQQDLASELLEGSQMVGRMAARASGKEAQWLRSKAQRMTGAAGLDERVKAAMDPVLANAAAKYQERHEAVDYEIALPVRVEQVRARHGAWYEFFPRSAGTLPGRSASFRDAESRLPYIASMGFDVLYLPPIHPIGATNRKGPNNTLRAGPKDPGSPWAIGSSQGGHKSVDPGLGTLKDFDHFVAAAKKQGLEIALDIAFQCSPDHPYVKEHPEWFAHRPDGSIKHAENPPKKYQDIYPFHFGCREWKSLWMELKSVVEFWIRRGVKIFRVDNPHTKPLPFWEWLIQEIQQVHPETVFLAEAFTRPEVMRRLAKAGFSQSYTYFTWRNTKKEITDYLTELTQTEVREYMRPNFFANTPDILHEYLQTGGRSAFQIRFILAATLGSNYGIYGPAFELCESAVLPGTEEYKDSEKYQLRQWRWDSPESLKPLIARVNQIRRKQRALQFQRNVRFYGVDNHQILCFSRLDPDGGGLIVVVSLDPHSVQSGWVWVPVGDFGLQPQDTYQVHDLLSDSRYLWRGESNFVKLDPAVCPAHIFQVRRRTRTEHDFDYFQ